MLTARLVLERLDKEGKTLESREQISKSFVRQLLGLLYVAHANLPSGSPYSMTDIDGQARNVDVDYQGVPLLIAAPPGDTDLVSYVRYDNYVHIAGNQVGIQVGAGTSAPTPTDYALASRIPHSSHVPELSDSRGEFYTDLNTASHQEAYGTRWISMRFFCLWTHQIRRVRLKLYREGSPGTVTVSIRHGQDGQPDLCSQTLDGNALTTDTAGEWKDIDFPSPYANLEFLEAYHIVIRATAGDSSNSVHIISDDDGTYGGGYGYYSSDSGSSWSYIYNTPDILFEEFGRNLSKGLEYSGCEVMPPIFAAPNGEFTIKRFFTNVSGGSWTINEVGIYALGTHYSNECWSFCIARDVVSPGITVLNGELLRVTYVPQITV